MFGAQKAPSGLLLREGDRARLRARWWSRLPAACRGSFQPGDPSLVRRCERYLLRQSGFSSYDIILKRGKSQSLFRFRYQKYAAAVAGGIAIHHFNGYGGVFAG